MGTLYAGDLCFIQLDGVLCSVMQCNGEVSQKTTRGSMSSFARALQVHRLHLDCFALVELLVIALNAMCNV